MWVGAWVASTALIVALARAVDVARLSRTLVGVDWRWLAAAVAANLLILPLGAQQWRILLPAAARITRRRITGLFAMTSVANNTTPALVGHAAGLLLLAAEPTIGQMAALSVFVLDQAAAGLAKIAVLAVASAVAPMPGWMRSGMIALVVGVSALVVTVAVAAHQHEIVARWSARTAVGSRVRRMLDLLFGWIRALEAARDPRRFVGGFAYALLVRAAEAGGIIAVQIAFGMTPTIASVFLVLSATALSSLVPITPANIGPYEAAAFAAYRALGLSAEAALGIAAAQHVCLLTAAVVPGYLVLTGRRWSPSSADPEPERTGMH